MAPPSGRVTKLNAYTHKHKPSPIPPSVPGHALSLSDLGHVMHSRAFGEAFANTASVLSAISIGPRIQTDMDIASLAHRAITVFINAPATASHSQS